MMRSVRAADLLVDEVDSWPNPGAELVVDPGGSGDVAITGAALKITADATAVSNFASLFLEQLGKVPAELVGVFLSRFESIPQACRFDVVTLPTSRANEVRIAFEPSDRLLALVTAMRAGDVDLV